MSKETELLVSVSDILSRWRAGQITDTRAISEVDTVFGGPSAKRALPDDPKVVQIDRARHRRQLRREPEGGRAS